MTETQGRLDIATEVIDSLNFRPTVFMCKCGNSLWYNAPEDKLACFDCGAEALISKGTVTLELADDKQRSFFKTYTGLER